MCSLWISPVTRGPFQYPIRRLTVRSHKVSKARDLYLELYDRSEIWQARRQRCCRRACQIAKRCDNLAYRSRGIDTSRDLTIRRLIGYWNGALVTTNIMQLRVCVLACNYNTIASCALWLWSIYHMIKWRVVINCNIAIPLTLNHINTFGAPCNILLPQFLVNHSHPDEVYPRFHQGCTVIWLLAKLKRLCETLHCVHKINIMSL